MSKKITEIKNILNDAADFKWLAFRLTDTGSNSIGKKFYGTQFMVNGIFACELYLKSIILMEDKKIKYTHKLNELYNLLEDSTKQKLIDEYHDIETFFKEQADSFVNWRYSSNPEIVINAPIEQTKQVLSILDSYCTEKINSLEKKMEKINIDYLTMQDLLFKQITEEEVKVISQIFDFNKLKINFSDRIFRDKEKLNLPNYENVRYYTLLLKRNISRLEIPFYNMNHYKNKYSEIEEDMRVSREPDPSTFSELYYYYFFETIFSIFSYIDKIYHYLNECLELNVVTNKGFEQKMLSSIKENEKLSSNEQVMNLVNYLESYNDSDNLYKTYKENYRNVYTHQYTPELPKYKEVDGEIYFEEFLNIDNTYEDCTKLLEEMKNMVDLFNKAIDSYLDDKLGVDD